MLTIAVRRCAKAVDVSDPPSERSNANTIGTLPPASW
jgi:hypothetical protein